MAVMKISPNDEKEFAPCENFFLNEWSDIHLFDKPA